MNSTAGLTMAIINIIILGAVAFAIMIAPTLETKQQKRDRIAVQFASDTVYWTQYYTWITKEGAAK